MRILHFIASFFPHARGATHSALRLAHALRTLGVQSEFLVEDQGPDWRQGRQYDGFPVRSFTVNHPGKLRKLSGYRKLRRYLRSRRSDFDIVHVHGGDYMNLLLANLASHWLGAPSLLKITSDGWDTPDGVRAAKHGRLALALYRHLDAVVAMTSGQAEKCRAWKIPARTKVIPNGVDPDQFRPALPPEKEALRQRLGLPAHGPIMAYGGWLGHGKGTDVLFQTWHDLRQRFPTLNLLLIGNYMGEQNMAQSLEGFLEQQGLPGSWARDPHVINVGKISDLAPYLQASDLFVFPSRREGFGTVQIEAMACGLPCVVNELPGVSCDIFPDPSTGIRIANNQVDDFVHACSHLLDHPDQAAEMGRLARARVIQHFSPDVVAQKYLSLYQQMLSPNGSAA